MARGSRTVSGLHHVMRWHVKYAAHRGRMSDDRRLITACSARALQRWTSRICMRVRLTCREVMPISNTRNQ
jgi:hypothetical protein